MTIILATIFFILSVVLIIWMRKRGTPFETREWMLVLVIAGFGLVITGKDYYENELHYTGVIERPEYGDGEEDVAVRLESKLVTDEIVVPVQERTLTDEEIAAYLELAKAEIDATILGENVDRAHISLPLTPQSSYADGNVKAEWVFGDGLIVNSGGVIEEEITEEETLYASVELTCQDTKELYEFPIVLVPLTADTEAGFRSVLSSELEELDDGEGDTVHLPDEVSGVRLTWKGVLDYSGVWLAALSLIAGAAILLSRKNDERRRYLTIQSKLDREYPRVLNMLSLYVSSGITVRQAMSRMVESYDKKLARGADVELAMELMKLSVREAESGVGEEEVFRRFGERSRNRKFRKLSLLLIQNLEKGTGMLASQLEQEAEEAYEEEKNRMRAEGEKLSTKLLLPMMGLLGVVLLLMIYPAIGGMKGYF